MKPQVIASAAMVALIVAAGTAQAGPIERGAREGAAVGNKAAGPVGGAVGTVMGGAAYGFRSGASKVLGVPEETGSLRRAKVQNNKRTPER